MKPATNTLEDLFRTEVRYMVPLYQRPYVWKKDTHWAPLWQDLVDVVEVRLTRRSATPRISSGRSCSITSRRRLERSRSDL